MKGLGRSLAKNIQNETSFSCASISGPELLVLVLRKIKLDTDLAFTPTPLAALDQFSSAKQ